MIRTNEYFLFVNERYIRYDGRHGEIFLWYYAFIWITACSFDIDKKIVLFVVIYTRII